MENLSGLQNISQSKLIDTVYVYRTVPSRKVYILYMLLLQLIFFIIISAHFYFSFVSNSLAYITIPKNNETEINWNEKSTPTLRLPNLVSLKKLKKVGKAPV